MTMLPSGGLSRDLFWPQLWYDVTHRDVCVCDCVISLFHCTLISFNSVIVGFLQINFVLFIGIIVILVQKLQSPDIGGNESSIYL